MKILRLIALCAVVSAVGCAAGLKVPTQSGQHPLTLNKTVEKKVVVNYLLYMPDGYSDKGEPWPLIMFLHGAGERGDDVSLVAVHGPPKLVAQGKKLPFVIVSPQCPAGVWWDDWTLMQLLDSIVATCNVDTTRIYLTGLSMGGYGTWDLAIKHPERFAAIAPICGGGTPYLTRQLVDMPVWVFHGAKDPVVPIAESEEMVEAFRQYGGNPRFTVYPEAQHDAWTATYDNPELYEWFLNQRKK